MSRLIVLLLVLILPCLALAADDMEKIKESLKALVPELEPDSIKPGPVEGLYEVVFGTRVFYISANGRYFLQGNILDTQTKTSLTEDRQTTLRAKLVQSMDESDMIVFSPESPKHRVTVFTDIDCGYCRKLHREIEAYNDAGIAIRYAAFPRSGPDTPSYFKAVSVWCGEDQKALMTLAKNGESFKQSKCENPIDGHMDVATKLGISGTPTIILEDGTMMPGYVPAQGLLKVLEQGHS
ncbi:MAG: disulfide bond formation protein DsbC [Gammaproteobacteria bacterium]|nr:MAG: disulfide bond formation protein DsbC [Gammaproteobacteria bacterium]